MANKIGRNKKKCERYRTSGHREANKKLAQERAQARTEHFAARKEAGKCYEYSKQHSAEKVEKYLEENEISKKYYEANKEIMDKKIFGSNKNSSKPAHTYHSRMKSVMRKLQNDLDAKTAAIKAKERRDNKMKLKAASV